MLERNDLEKAIDEVVAELADSRQCIVTRPMKFEGRILEIAMLHHKGVINVMGVLAKHVSCSTRFNPARKEQILHQLKLRGVGVAQPSLRCF